MNVWNDAEKIRERIVAWRRAFHQIPELQGETPKTEALIAETLRSVGIKEIRTGVGGHGVTALIRGALPGKCLAIRADCDALPIREETGLPFASQNGCMHACGHDAHTAMVLGAAALLWEHRDELRGTVKMVFQPYEEGGKGAPAMIRDGVLQDPKVDAMIGLHIGNIMGLQYDSGDVIASPDPVSACIYGFKATLRGKGAHVATPEQAVDPVQMSAEAALWLREMVARERAEGEVLVGSVTTIHGGVRNNIIPDTCVIEGSIRAFDQKKHDAYCASFRNFCEKTARKRGGSVEFETVTQAPSTKNDQALYERFMEIAGAIVPAEKLKRLQSAPYMGEDFAYFSDCVPSLYFYLCSKPENGPCYPHHHPKFDIREKDLPLGSALFTEFALHWQA